MLPRNFLGRAALAFAFSTSLLIPAGPAHAQSDEEKAAARSLAKQGAEALNNSKFSETVDLVTRAESIVHAPTHLLLIGRAQVGLGRLVAAQETFLKLVREDLPASAPEAFRKAQAAGKEELAAIEPRIASLRIVLDGLGQKKVTVKMDDQIVPPALVGVHRPVDPGKHEIGIYPVGGSPVKSSVELKDGEKKEIKLVVPDVGPSTGVPVSAADNPDAGKPETHAAPPPVKGTGSGFMTPLRGAGIGVGAVGIAGVVVGALFMAKSGASQSDADAAAIAYGCTNGGTVCPKPKTPADQKAVQHFGDLDNQAARQKTIGAIGLAVGGVALAGGVVMLIIGKPAAQTPKKASIEPWFGGTSLGLRGAF